MSYDYQELVSGFCYVTAAFTHWKVTGDEALMKDLYPSIKKALQYSFTQRPDNACGTLIGSFSGGSDAGRLWYDYALGDAEEEMGPRKSQGCGFAHRPSHGGKA